MEDFSSLNIRSYALLYKGLLALIDSESGYGFHNQDKGHPAYRMQPPNYKQWGDDPEHNQLFQLLMSLKDKIEQTMKKFRERWGDFDIKEKDVIKSWEEFCEWALKAYNKHRELKTQDRQDS